MNWYLLGIRKFIILDVKDLSGMILIGIAAIILALAGGYHLLRFRRNGRAAGPDGEEE